MHCTPAVLVAARAARSRVYRYDLPERPYLEPVQMDTRISSNCSIRVEQESSPHRLGSDDSAEKGSRCGERAEWQLPEFRGHLIGCSEYRRAIAGVRASREARLQNWSTTGVHTPC